MTRDEIIEYLERYGVCCKKIILYQEQLEALREVEQSAKTQQLSDMPKGSSRDSDLSDVLVKIEMLQDKIDDKIAEALCIQVEIEDFIVSRIDDPVEASVIRKRYIELKTWKVIADECKYSVANVKTIRGRAVKKIKVNTK